MELALIQYFRQRLSAWAELVVFVHAVFMLPFMAASLALASGLYGFSWLNLLWVVLAHLSARHVAMLGNRIIDLPWDALNPRTQNRALVTGQVSRQEARLLFIVNLLVFLLACWCLNWLCLVLAPLAIFIIVGYSYSKRFTSLCHLWLGLACALGPMGAWVGFSGNFMFSIWPLGLGCALWVAGFDVIYACQDIDFDRQHHLYSLPAKLGQQPALLLSRLMHLGALLFFLSLYWLFNLHPIYLVGCLLMACGLFYQQFLSLRRHFSPLAFTCVNGVISLVYFVFTLLAIAL